MMIERKTAVFILAGFAAITLWGNDTAIAPWVDPAHTASPVSRLFDALSMGPNSVQQSSHVENRAIVLEEDGRPVAFRWHTFLRPDASDAPQWATLRGTIPENAIGKISGVRVSFDAEDDGEMVGEFFENANMQESGFRNAKSIGRQTRPFGKGPNTLTFSFDEDDASGEKIASGFGMVLKKFPQTLYLRGIDLIFPDVSDAESFRHSEERRKGARAATMRRWVEARGISLAEADGFANTFEYERALWMAAHLLALSEQVTYWNSLCATLETSVSRKQQGQSLLAGINELAHALPTLNNDEVIIRIDQLQEDTDLWIDALQDEIPLDDRRWDKFPRAERFMRPDGQPYRMFAPFFFRSIYHPNAEIPRIWKKEDVRYLSSLGFNGLRLVVVWALLEPEQGKFDAEYVRMLRGIMKEAERYGLGVSIDLHWPYPDWFIQGSPQEKTARKHVDRHNAYQWQEAVIEAWRQLGETLRDVPNIVAFEVPTNETKMAGGPRGVLDYPSLNRLWNTWLKETYGTREALASAWNSPVKNRTYPLQPDEDWETLSIRPMGFQGDSSPAEAYAESPRFWDHVRWAAWMQRHLTGGIMRALRQSIPNATGMMQYTIGDVWDKSAVPVNYKSISTQYGPHVLPGTHYGMGGIDAMKAATLTLKSYDSEQQMENRQQQVERHLALGLGFCPFSFHRRGGGGMLFQDDDWYLKDSVSYLPENAARIRGEWPSPRNSPKVAYIQNTRRAAASDSTFGGIAQMAEEKGVSMGVLEGLQVVENAKLLEGYGAVILNARQLDQQLLALLISRFPGRVLLYGAVDSDAYARKGEHGSAETLANAGLLFNKGASKRVTQLTADVIDLEGEWQFSFTGKGPQKPQIPKGKLKWEKKSVPGTWGEIGILGSLKYLIGDGWYRKSVMVPQNWEKRSLRFEVGAIDDFDWVFFNGILIGHTGASRADWWQAPRDYVIPANLVRLGRSNEIYICVRNDADDAGITRSPVRIVATGATEIVWKNGGRTPIRLGSSANFFKPAAVHSQAQVLATVSMGNDEGGIPALIAQDRWFWWIGDSVWDPNNASDRRLLDKFLDFHTE